MKFDVVIGNPPYQGDLVGDSTTQPAIYNYFMEAAYNIGDISLLITPARFLFNTGRTPKSWNNKMLNDPHLKILNYFAKSPDVFINTDIKGGLAISYRNVADIIGPIGTFTAYNELNSILEKVSQNSIDTLDSIITSQTAYKFTTVMHNDNPESLDILSYGNSFVVGTGVLKSLDGIVFFENKPSDGEEYIGIYGLIDSKRVLRWVRKDYINEPINLTKWKVFVPQANGSGALGEVLSTPLIGQPLIGHTQTFISIGLFNNELHANACMKYVKSKFTRVLLGVLKATQHNPPRTWSKIPIQDFTDKSDTDWSKSIPEIDQQLYAKYNLNDEEIHFIETHVKEMA